MTASDETVLELLHEKDVALKPKIILVNLEREGIESSKSSIDRAIRKLSNAGMIQQYGDYRACYEITQFGRDFLEENATSENLKQALDDYDL